MCGCQIGKMAKKGKRISGIGDAGSIAMNLLPIVGGYLLGNVVEKQFLSGTSYANIAKLAGGVIIASMTKGTIAQLGVGMALNGAVDIAQPALESAGLGLLPPGAPARYMAGFYPDQGKTFDGQQFPFRGFP